MIFNKEEYFLKVHHLSIYNGNVIHFQMSRHCEPMGRVVRKGEAICQRLWAAFHRWWFYRKQIALAFPPARPHLRCFAMTGYGFIPAYIGKDYAPCFKGKSSLNIFKEVKYSYQ